MLPSGGFAHQQVEGAIGGLDLVPLCFQVLHPVEDRSGGFVIELHPLLTGFAQDGRPAGHLRNDHTRGVADFGRSHVLVSVGSAGQSRGV